MRGSIHQVGVHVNQLTKNLLGLRKEPVISKFMDSQLQEISKSIDSLNHLFNDVYMKALQADTDIAEVQVTCKTTLSYQSHLTKHDTLLKKYKELE